MSRPHDGQRTFFPFGNPFRMILPKGSHLSPKLLMLLNSFEQILAEKLKQLKPKDISDVLTISWMTLAIEFLSETHNHIKTLITDLLFPVSDWDEKWVDIYLDTSVKLLDVCIALSSELSRLDQGQLLLQYVLHLLDSTSNFCTPEQLERAHASLHDWIQQINTMNTKLENCSVILQGVAETVDVAKVKNSAKGKVLMKVLYGVKVVTIYICSIIVAALSGCTKPLMELKVPNKFIWAEAFNNLQGEVNKEMRTRLSNRKDTVLKELEAVETCVERLLASAVCSGEKELGTSQKSSGISKEVQTLVSSSDHEGELKELEAVETCEERLLASAVCSGEKELGTSQKSSGISKEVQTLVSSSDHEGEFGRQYVSDLAGSAERVAHELGLLSKQVGEFFQIILTGRDALLCNLRETDVMEVQNADVSKLQGS